LAVDGVDEVTLLEAALGSGAEWIDRLDVWLETVLNI
jgi:hypothetical protein